MFPRFASFSFIIFFASFVICFPLTSSEQPKSISLSGQVVSEDGAPVSDAFIVLLDRSLVPMETFSSSHDGNFSHDVDLEKGFLLRIQKDGFIPFDLQREAFLEQRGNLRIVLEKASQLSGTVLDGVSFIPLRGARASLLKEEEGNATETVSNGVTDEHGRYLFRSIPGRNFFMKIAKESFIPCSESIALKKGEQRILTHFLFKGASLSGSVRDKEKKAIKGVDIRLLKNLSSFFREKSGLFHGEEYSAESSDDGTYSITDIPQYGGYRISVSADGCAPRIVPFDMLAATNTLVIDLQKASSILFKVRDEKERSIADVDTEIRPHSEEVYKAFTHTFEKKYRPSEAGLVRIPDLSPGNYTLTLTSPGHIPKVYEVSGLKEGENRDLGNISLRSGLVISGTVQAETGEAVGDARLEATLSGSGGKLYVRSAESDEDGAFSIGGLKEGVYTIAAEAEGYSREMMKGIRAGKSKILFTMREAGLIRGMVMGEGGEIPKTFFIALEPEDVGSEREGRIYRSFSAEAGAHDAGRYEIENLKPGRYTVSAGAPGYSEESKKGVELFAGMETAGIDFFLSRGAKIEGYVYDKEQSFPLPGSFITAIARGSRHEPPGTVSDATGYFLVEGVPRRAVSVMAEHPEYAPLLVDDIDPTDEGSAFPLKMYLERGGTVEGSVLEADDTPVYGARLSVQHPGKSLEAISDMSGYYLIDHVPAGSHSIVKTVPRLDYYSDYESREFTIQNHDIIRIDFKSFTEVSGMITRKGVPVEGARITFIEAPEASYETSKLSVRASYTDSTGSYRIKGLKEGRYSVVVENAEKRFVKITEIPKVKEYRYDILYPDYEITGRVVDGETGAPIPLASVHALPAGTKSITIFDQDREIDGVTSKITGATAEMQATTTDAEGFFSFFVEAPGQYAVTAVSPGYMRKPVMITVEQNMPPVEIALYRGATFKGTVRSEHGGIPSAASVQMVREGYSLGTSVDVDGRFVFDDLHPAVYTLSIFSPALAPLIVDNYTIESGKVYEETLVMKEGAPLKIAIDPADLPVSMAILDGAGRDFYAIFVHFLKEEIIVEKKEDRIIYSFPNLPPGIYKVTVVLQDTPKEQEIEIFNGVPASLEFEFQ